MIDASILAILVLAWVLVVVATTRGVPSVADDTFHAMAYAENILAGRPAADPSLPGYPGWQAPGSPLLFAGLSRLLRVPLVDLYASSRYWLNVLNPLLLYLLARAVWGSRAAGVMALGFVGFGFHGWLTQAFAPTPAVQGVALNLAALMLWNRAQRGSRPWIVATGVTIALSAWHDPTCGLVALGAIGAHGLWSASRRSGLDPPEGHAIRARALAACGIGCVLSLPLLASLLAAAVGGREPVAHIGEAVRDGRLAPRWQATLVPVLGGLGLWQILRTTPALAWIAGYAAAGAAGGIAAGLARLVGWPIPYTLLDDPWAHTSLALGLGAVAGIQWCAGPVARAAPGTPARRRRVSRRTAAIVSIATIAIGPSILSAPRARSEAVALDADWDGRRAAARWIRGHAPIDAVMAAEAREGYVLSGLTGRKVVALPARYMHPRSDARRRHADLLAMLQTSEMSRFAEAASRYRVGYLLVVRKLGTLDTARERYAGWAILEPVDLGDPDVLLYRLRDGQAGRPAPAPP